MHSRQTDDDIIRLKSKDDIERIAEAGHLVALFFHELECCVCLGMSTLDIERLAEDFVQRHHVIAEFKHVKNYFHCTCISINYEVVHGIPRADRLLCEGDLVKVDMGIRKNGFVGDATITLGIGYLSEKAKLLKQVTKECLDFGIQAAQVGKKIGDIGFAIQRHAENYGYGVVRQFVGHGVGYGLHEAPSVPHFGLANTGLVLEEGLVIAIEPMINQGTHKCKILADGWTAVTADKKLSCQFEHTVAITANGPRVLTI